MMGNKDNYKKFPTLVDLNVAKSTNFHSLRWLNLLNIMTVIINILVSFSYIETGNKVERRNMGLIMLLSFTNMVLAVCILFFVVFMRLKNYYLIENQKRQKVSLRKKKLMPEKGINHINLLAFVNVLLWKKDITPFLFHVVVSMLGVFCSEYFFTVQCFSVVF